MIPGHQRFKYQVSDDDVPPSNHRQRAIHSNQRHVGNSYDPETAYFSGIKNILEYLNIPEESSESNEELLANGYQDQNLRHDQLYVSPIKFKINEVDRSSFIVNSDNLLEKLTSRKTDFNEENMEEQYVPLEVPSMEIDNYSDYLINDRERNTKRIPSIGPAGSGVISSVIINEDI